MHSNTDSALDLKNDILISEKWKARGGTVILSFTPKQLLALHSSRQELILFLDY